MNIVISPIDAASRFLAALQKPSRLLIAVSGGSDSIGLLVALKQAASTYAGAGVTLLAATIDHRLRRESADEAVKVAELCAELGISHFTRAWEGLKPGTGISAAARDARYRLLVEIAAENGADAIVSGHTLDDQLETIAMRACRSRTSESLGLAGMADAVLLESRAWLVRPFLATRRADIRLYLNMQGRGWIDDPSNLDRSYERVRTRLTLAEAGEAVVTDWQAIGERRRQLSLAAAALLQKHVSVHAGVLAVAHPDVLAADPEVLRHALSALIAVLGGRAYGPGNDRMARVLGFLSSNSPGRITAGRVLIDRRRECFYLRRENRDILPLHLGIGGSGLFDGRFQVALDQGEGPAMVASCPQKADRPLADFDDVPPAIARAAAHMLPDIRNLETGADLSGAARVVPVLPPYDRFLPEFDLELANQMAVLFGRAPYSFPPRQPR